MDLNETDEMEPVLDSKLVQILTESIEYIACNGQRQAESAKIKEIKKICRYQSIIYLAFC